MNVHGHGQVHVLHSLVPKDQVDACMRPALKGHCKIVLSTNMAESSVTIVDVRYPVCNAANVLWMWRCSDMRVLMADMDACMSVS